LSYAKAIARAQSARQPAIEAELFKALAQPGRVRVLEALADSEPSVGALGPRWHRVVHLSQQLAVLRRAGLVTPRGAMVIYAVRSEAVGELLGAAQRFLIAPLSDTSDLLADLRGAL